jgi:hypothetical protein
LYLLTLLLLILLGSLYLLLLILLILLGCLYLLLLILLILILSCEASVGSHHLSIG